MTTTKIPETVTIPRKLLLDFTRLVGALMTDTDWDALAGGDGWEQDTHTRYVRMMGDALEALDATAGEA